MNDFPYSYGWSHLLGSMTADRVITLAAGIDGTVRRISRTYVPRGMRAPTYLEK